MMPKMEPVSQSKDLDAAELKPLTPASISGLLYDLAKQQSSTAKDEAQFLSLISTHLEGETEKEILGKTFDDLANFILLTDCEESVLAALELGKRFPEHAAELVPGAAFHFLRVTPDAAATILEFIEQSSIGTVALYVPLCALALQPGEPPLPSQAGTVAANALQKALGQNAQDAAAGISPKLAARLQRFVEFIAAPEIAHAAQLSKEAALPLAAVPTNDRIVLQANALAILGCAGPPEDQACWETMAWLNLAHAGPGTEGQLELLGNRLLPTADTAKYRNLALLANAPASQDLRSRIFQQIYSDLLAPKDTPRPVQGADQIKLLLDFNAALFGEDCLLTSERVLRRTVDYDCRNRLFQVLVDAGAAPIRVFRLLERSLTGADWQTPSKTKVVEQLSALFHLHRLYVSTKGEQFERILVKHRIRKLLEKVASAREVDSEVLAQVLARVSSLGENSARVFYTTAITDNQARRPGRRFPTDAIETMLWADDFCRKIRRWHPNSEKTVSTAAKTMQLLERLDLKRARRLYEIYLSSF